MLIDSAVIVAGWPAQAAQGEVDEEEAGVQEHAEGEEAPGAVPEGHGVLEGGHRASRVPQGPPQYDIHPLAEFSPITAYWLI